jgi:5'(3')-deoxyribonucleotidase
MTCEVAMHESLLMRILATLILFTFLSFLFPATIFSEVIVQDRITLKGKEIMLSAETRGKLFTKGGEVVEFFVDGKPLGRSLSGGDGFAFKQFTPPKTGMYRITAKSSKEEGNGLLISLKKGWRIVFIDVEGTLFEGLLSTMPKKGSQEVIKKIAKRFQVVFLHTGLRSIKAIKTWLKENGFIDLPVIPWGKGIIFDEIAENGLKIKAVIGDQSVIESAKGYKPESLSFEDVEDAVEVKDWEEIGKKLK